MGSSGVTHRPVHDERTPSYCALWTASRASEAASIGSCARDPPASSLNVSVRHDRNLQVVYSRTSCTRVNRMSDQGSERRALARARTGEARVHTHWQTLSIQSAGDARRLRRAKRHRAFQTTRPPNRRAKPVAMRRRLGMRQPGLDLVNHHGALPVSCDHDTGHTAARQHMRDCMYGVP